MENLKIDKTPSEAGYRRNRHTYIVWKNSGIATHPAPSARPDLAQAAFWNLPNPHFAS
jgi:hypothetical protein